MLCLRWACLLQNSFSDVPLENAHDFFPNLCKQNSCKLYSFETKERPSKPNSVTAFATRGFWGPLGLEQGSCSENETCSRHTPAYTRLGIILWVHFPSTFFACGLAFSIGQHQGFSQGRCVCSSGYMLGGHEQCSLSQASDLLQEHLQEGVQTPFMCVCVLARAGFCCWRGLWVDRWLLRALFWKGAKPRPRNQPAHCLKMSALRLIFLAILFLETWTQLRPSLWWSCLMFSDMALQKCNVIFSARLLGWIFWCEFWAVRFLRVKFWGALFIVKKEQHCWLQSSAPKIRGWSICIPEFEPKLGLTRCKIPSTETCPWQMSATNVYNRDRVDVSKEGVWETMLVKITARASFLKGHFSKAILWQNRPPS